VVKAFSLPNYLAYWSAGDGFVVGTHPSQPHHAEEFGILNFNGEWKELKPPFKTKNRCFSVMDALDLHLIAAYGCNGVVAFSESGEQVFHSYGRVNESPVGIANAGNYFAVEFFYPPDIHNSQSRNRPSHLDIFDLKSGARLISLSLQTSTVYYDVSAQGLLAVLEGDTLRVFTLGSE
jgi:hypothetical protein